jgi:large subunit ribosomal protein L9
MKVILLEDVVGAGSAGDVVEVKNGYARNKLLPAGIAIEANKENMRTLEHRRVQIAAKKTADKEMAQTLCAKIEGKQIEFTAKAGETGKLFGSVTAHDITAKLNEALGFELDRRKLLLDSHLKETGAHKIKYRVYPEVEATVIVNIIAEGTKASPTEEAAAEEETAAEEEAAAEAAEEAAEEAEEEAEDAAYEAAAEEKAEAEEKEEY